MFIQNLLSSICAFIFPPIRSTSSFAIESPRPLDVTLLARQLEDEILELCLCSHIVRRLRLQFVGFVAAVVSEAIESRTRQAVAIDVAIGAATKGKNRLSRIGNRVRNIGRLH